MDPAFVPLPITCFGLGCLVWLLLCVLSFIFGNYYYYIFVLKHCSSCSILDFDFVAVAFNRCCREFSICCFQNYGSLGVLHFLGVLGCSCQYKYLQIFVLDLILDFLWVYVLLNQVFLFGK